MLLKFKKSIDRWACVPSTGKPVIGFLEGEIKEVKDEYCKDLLDAGVAVEIDAPDAPIIDNDGPSEVETDDDYESMDLKMFEKQLNIIATDAENAKTAKDRLEEIGFEMGIDLNKSKSVKNLVKELLELKKEMSV